MQTLSIKLFTEYAHKFKIVNQDMILDTDTQSYIVPHKEVHFSKILLRDTVNINGFNISTGEMIHKYYVFHNDNHFWFDIKLIDRIGIDNVKKRIKLFLIQSLNMKVFEPFKCDICYNQCQNHHSCFSCNIVICSECKLSLIKNSHSVCPKCRTDFHNIKDVALVVCPNK